MSEAFPFQLGVDGGAEHDDQRRIIHPEQKHDGGRQLAESGFELTEALDVK